MIRGTAVALALLVWSGAGAGAGTLIAQTVRIQDAGPGPGPELLQRELAQPHVVIPPAAQRALLRRDTTYASTVVVLGRDVVVEGKVDGDVVVVGGDLYTHPGAAVTGRLIAFGGGVYRSALATDAGTVAYRDFTYDIAPESGGYALDYRELNPAPPGRVLALSGLPGFELPLYDRSNGLSIPLGVAIAPRGARLVIEPRLTYRSQLGQVDPSVAIEDSLGRQTAITFWAGQGTFTNEAWIWPDLLNSAEFLFAGNDARNYYRATRERLTIARRAERGSFSIEPYLGAQHEHPSTVRPQPGAQGGPWTMFGRHGADDALRPNPTVQTTGITSALGGLRLGWTPGDIVAHLDADGEIGAADAACASLNCPSLGALAQLTLDGAIDFPTFGTQSLAFRGHGLISSHDTPRERFAYLGGQGTIPTLKMLELGGDQLVYVDALYNVPIDRLQLPLVGPPVLAVREVIAGAAVNAWPTLRQAVGVRATLGFVYGEFLVDPTHHFGRFSAGIATGR